MAVLNQFPNTYKFIILGLTLSAPLCFGAMKTLDLSSSWIVSEEAVKVKQGSMLLLKVSPQAKIHFNDKSILVSDDGTAIIALHRDDTKADLTLVLDDQEQHIPLTVQQRDYRIERVDGLPPGKVTAPMNPKIRERIRLESAAVRQARTRFDDRQDFQNGFIWPVEGRISGVYGSQRILNGIPKTPHYGVDIAVPMGTPIKAPAAGVITFVNNDMYYSGGTLVLDHGHGLSSAFLHLSKISVAVGDVIKQGQTIGLVGSTGRSTGPHLDWRMNWGTSVRIDPQLLVPPMKRVKEYTLQK